MRPATKKKRSRSCLLESSNDRAQQLAASVAAASRQRTAPAGGSLASRFAVEADEDGPPAAKKTNRSEQGNSAGAAATAVYSATADSAATATADSVAATATADSGTATVIADSVAATADSVAASATADSATATAATDNYSCGSDDNANGADEDGEGDGFSPAASPLGSASSFGSFSPASPDSSASFVGAECAETAASSRAHVRGGVAAAVPVDSRINHDNDNDDDDANADDDDGVIDLCTPRTTRDDHAENSSLTTHRSEDGGVDESNDVSSEGDRGEGVGELTTQPSVISLYDSQATVPVSQCSSFVEPQSPNADTFSSHQGGGRAKASAEPKNRGIVEREREADSNGNVQWLVVLVGLPGSGKSTLADQLLSRGFGQAGPVPTLVVCQDLLGSKAKCLKLANEQLKNGGSVIVDRTNLSQAQREDFLELYWAQRERGVRRVAVVIGNPGAMHHKQWCLERCAARKSHPTLPPGMKLSRLKGILTRLQNSFRMPTRDEGFDRVEVLPNDQAMDIFSIRGLL
eukprot:INCI3247.6.p1 GENE.INCI3247.6~~INCI3247.6.p1  ORF type:complete len:522 (+),score=116.43 INCI3247.6:35-1600(+)